MGRQVSAFPSDGGTDDDGLFSRSLSNGKGALIIASYHRLTMDLFLAKTAVSFVILLSAGLYDIIRREIPDGHWWLLGAVSVIPDSEIGIQWAFTAIGYVSMLVLILIDPGRMRALLLTAMAVSFVIPLFVDPWTNLKGFISVPVCCLLYFVMYRYGILKGGADAKCVMVLSMFRIDFHTVPFSMEVLMIASAIVVIVFIPLMIVNLFRGERKHLAHIRMSISDARDSFVWPAQDVVNGKVIDRISDRDALDRLESIGEKSLWTVPMIPFVTFIAAAFPVAVFVL